MNFSRLESTSHPIAYATRALPVGIPGTGGIPVSGALAGSNPRNQDWWLLGATNSIGTIQDHAKFKFAHDFTDTWHLAYTFGAWHNDATRSADTWLRDANGDPVHSGRVNIGGRMFDIAPTEMGPSTAELTHFMHGLWLRKQPARGWDLVFAASLYDYQRDSVRSPVIALPLAAQGGAGRIADQSGTGWSTFQLRATWNGEHDDGGHLVEIGLADEYYRLRTEIEATDDWQSGPPGARVSAFRGNTRLTSLFAQDSWRFAPEWRATVGARFEQWRAYDGAVANASQVLGFAARSDTHVSPKLAIAWAASGITTLKASVGRAVRMPTVSELFQGSIALDAIVNNDPGLSPERSWTAEFSAVNEFDHSHARATLFFEDTRDALYAQLNQAAGATVTTVQNVDHVRTRGVEVACRWQPLQSLELDGSLTYAHSRVLANVNFPASEGRHQPRVPDWRANMLANWNLDERFSVAMGARYSGLQYNQLDNSDTYGAAYTGTSRFLVFDARVRFDNGRLSAALGIDNLGNERYWAFHPYARRTLSAEISASL
jgi:iron complex outermembrane receptor protein